MATAVEDEWRAEPIWAPAGPTMTDGTFATRLKITAVAAGLWFRATDTANNYMWQLRADGIAGVLRKHVRERYLQRPRRGDSALPGRDR